MMPTIDEHRRRERHTYDKHVLCYKCVSSNPMYKIKVPFLFVIQDISYGGMGISTDKKLYVGSVMAFRLDTAEGNREFKVMVKWSKYYSGKYVSGLQFIEVVKEDIIFLHQIVNHLM
jgi:hypothetical protein